MQLETIPCEFEPLELGLDCFGSDEVLGVEKLTESSDDKVDDPAVSKDLMGVSSRVLREDPGVPCCVWLVLAGVEGLANLANLLLRI